MWVVVVNMLSERNQELKSNSPLSLSRSAGRSEILCGEMKIVCHAADDDDDATCGELI